MKVPKALQKEYKSLKPILRKCLAELKHIIIRQLRKIENPGLVRIRLTEARVKSLISLWRKAQKKNWKVKAILKEVRDLVGFRIVCSNLEDIHRIKELLLSNPRIKEIPDSVENRTAIPTESGYRDFKFCILYDTGDTKYGDMICEVQIRTALQDSWAILSHKDIYKEDDNLPEPIKKLSYRLSDLLHVADQIAQDIRDQVSQKREPVKRGGRIVTEDTLRILFKRLFGELPPDYLVRLVKDKCDELGITHLKPLEDAIVSDKNGRRLKKAYEKVTGWDIPNEVIFEASPLIVTFGIKIATDAINKRGKQELEEIDQTYRREIESELPTTFREFLKYLEDDLEDFPDRIYRLAVVFNAVKECDICGTSIVDKEIFSENAQEYYKKEDLKGRIVSAVFHSGVDTGEGGLCPYHAHIMSKDD